jgi:hypothetical protein
MATFTIDLLNGNPYLFSGDFGGGTGSTSGSSYYTKAEINAYTASTNLKLNQKLDIAVFTGFTAMTSSDYKIVESKAAKDAIPLADRKYGLLVNYIDLNGDNQTKQYQHVDLTDPYWINENNWFELNKQMNLTVEEDVPHLFVDGTSGDDNNDGSELSPFLTFEKAFRTIPTVVRPAGYTGIWIFVRAGTYDFPIDIYPQMRFHYNINNVVISCLDSTLLYSSVLLTQDTTDPTKFFCTVGGVPPTWTPGELKNKWITKTQNTPSSYQNYHTPIFDNGVDYIIIPRNTAWTDSLLIVEFGVTINFNSITFPIGGQSGFQITGCIFNLYNSSRYLSGSPVTPEINFNYCHLRKSHNSLFTTSSYFSATKININYCIVEDFSASVRTAGILTQLGTVSTSIIRTASVPATNGYGVMGSSFKSEYIGGVLIFENMYICIFGLVGDTYINCIKAVNCTSVIGIRQTYLSKIKINQLILEGTITNVVDLQYQSLFDPAQNFELYISEIIGSYSNLFKQTDFKKLYQPAKGIIVHVDGQYSNFEISDSIDLINATSGETVIGSITQNRSIKISYQIRRGSLNDCGSIFITNDISNPIGWNVEYDGGCGYIFDRDIDGDEIKLTWTDPLADGNNGVLEMTSIERVRI